MSQRANPFAAMPLIQPLIDFGMTVQAMGLEPSLMELVKIRASQINGCGMCLHMHTAEARKQGETEERIYLLDAWRDSPLYSPREQAALAWTDSLTRLTGGHVSDEVYDQLAAQFTPDEQFKLTQMIVAINGFNRVNAAFRVRHPVNGKQAAAA